MPHCKRKNKYCVNLFFELHFNLFHSIRFPGNSLTPVLQQLLRTHILLPKLSKQWLGGGLRAGREGRAAEETKEHCGVLISLPKLFTYQLQRDAKGEGGQTNHRVFFPPLHRHYLL